MLNLGIETSFDKVEHSLARLWDQNDAAVKASINNFVIISHEKEELENSLDLISELVKDHACRAILIHDLYKTSTKNIRTWITAHCQIMGSGKKSACSEQIATLLNKQSVSSLNNIIFSLLESDLPFILFWKGAVNERLKRTLLSRVDYLIVDSHSWKNFSKESKYNSISKQYSRIFETFELAHENYIFHDISWTRTNPMRNAIAKTFDMPQAQRILSKSKKIILKYNPNYRISGVFMLVWLIQCNKWNVDCKKKIFSLEDPDVISSERIIVEKGDDDLVKQAEINLVPCECADETAILETEFISDVKKLIIAYSAEEKELQSIFYYKDTIKDSFVVNRKSHNNYSDLLAHNLTFISFNSSLRKILKFYKEKFNYKYR